MIEGKKCGTCKGTGIVECTAGTQEGSFSPMKCLAMPGVEEQVV